MTHEMLQLPVQRAAHIVAQEPAPILEDYRAAVTDDLRRRRADETVRQLTELNKPDANARPTVVGLKELRVLADRVVELLYFSGHQREAAEAGLPFPIYDVSRSYEYNAALPWLRTPASRPTASARRWTLLGRDIGFPIGVPASALTGSASQIVALAQSGYNVITFKTVRSQQRHASPQPNWVVLPDETAPLDISVDRRSYRVHGSTEAWLSEDRALVSTANSFGVPSAAPAEWMPEVEEALRLLNPDQMLILSVMGDDYDQSGSRSKLIADWVKVALLGEQTGAHAIELNLSCPNTLAESSDDGVLPPLCEDAALTVEIVRAVRSALRPDIPLIGKLSYLSYEHLETLVLGIGGAVDAYSGINTLQMLVEGPDGAATFGSRARAGVSGIAVRNFALEFVARLTRLRLTSGLPFEIIGMGGVTDPPSFKALHAAGAAVVQSAAGVFGDPQLAAACVAAFSADLPAVPSIQDASIQAEVDNAIIDILARGRANRYEIAAALAIPPAQATASLADLVEQRRLRQEPNGQGAPLYSLVASRG